jgi:hypothetical protein
MDGQHRRRAPQGQQQVLGAVEQIDAGHEPVEADAGHLPQQHGHAPRLVAPAHRAPRRAHRQRGRELPTRALVIEQGVALRPPRQQRARQPLAVAAQAGLAMHGGRNIYVDHEEEETTDYTDYRFRTFVICVICGFYPKTRRVRTAAISAR